MKSKAAVKGALFCAGVWLTGCAAPFGQSADIDWTPKPTTGTITVSSPKMYRREALVDERRQDVTWIDKLLKDSETIEFKPEIAREVEQITALSAALGLSFDPASALTYRRAKESGDLQQQIDVIKLQTQLDQLRRDAELVRGKFEGQSDPLNADLGKTGPGAVAPANGNGTAAATQLSAAIDKLITTLTTRLDADGKPIMAAGTSSNPADLFRDRQAYRDLLKTARNAASLDELHDLNGNALIRLSFQATVLPDPAKPRAPGVIQMVVTPPAPDASRAERLYSGWLSHINERLNIAGLKAGEWAPDPALMQSAVADNFDLVEYAFAPTPSSEPPPPAKPKPKAGKGKAATKPASPAAPLKCPGLLLDGETADAGCRRLYFAVPRFNGVAAGEGASTALASYVAAFSLERSENEDLAEDARMAGLIGSQASAIVTYCKTPYAAPVIGTPTDAQELYHALRRARVREAGGDVVVSIYRSIERIIGAKPAADGQRAATISQRTARARLFSATFERAAYANCPASALGAFRRWRPTPAVPATFSAMLDPTSGRVAVYEVGPREQVQQMSTMARNAESLGLALSIAAAAPGTGQAANAAVGYSKQAVGKAATLERVPNVVGYTEGAGSVFGWVISPRANVLPKGKIDFAQALKPYDLTVDLSVPAWWPEFMLQTRTIWSPGASAVASGKVQGDARSIVVPMSQNVADFSALTHRLALGGALDLRSSRLQPIEGAVSACKATTLFIQGDAVWRSTAVLVGGVKLTGSALSIAPDMSGMLVDVPDLDGKIAQAGARVTVTVLTPYGPASEAVDYIAKPATGCKEDKPSDGPTVSSLEPGQVQAPAPLNFVIKGAKLDAIDRVTLGGQVGKIVQENAGKGMQVSFTTEQTAGLPVSRSVKLVFYKEGASVAEKLVEVTANAGGK